MGDRPGRGTEVLLAAAVRAPTLFLVTKKLAVSFVCVAALIWIGLPHAHAHAESLTPRVVRRGACSVASSWKLRVVPDDQGMLRVRFTLLGGAVGEKWNVYLDQNGTGFFAGSRTSRDGGLVSVGRLTTDSIGVDLIGATAHDVISDETCRGHVSAP